MADPSNILCRLYIDTLPISIQLDVFTKSTKSVKFFPVESGTVPSFSMGRLRRFTQKVG